MAVAKALESGSRAIMCASTGNTSASAAAYGGRFSISTVVVVPKGRIAAGKVTQAMAHGARIIMVDGSFDQALSLVRNFTDQHPITLVNSINPYRLEGQKTAAFEIVDDLGDAPDYLFIPTGNAGNITAYWQGFREYYQAEISRSLPKMMGFQAEGAAPIVRGHPVEDPTTIASAIRIGNPANWTAALAARDDSGGAIDMVSDDDGHDVLTAPDDLHAVREAMERSVGEPQAARLIWKPQTLVPVEEERAVALFRLLEALDDHDDVQAVSANYDVSDEVLARLAG